MGLIGTVSLDDGNQGYNMCSLQDDPETSMNLDIQEAFCVEFSPRKWNTRKSEPIPKTTLQHQPSEESYSDADVVFQRTSRSETPSSSLANNEGQVKARRRQRRNYGNGCISRPQRVLQTNPVNEYEEYEAKPIRTRSFFKHSFTKLREISKEITVFLNGPPVYVYPGHVLSDANMDGLLMEYSLRRAIGADGGGCQFNEIIGFEQDVPCAFEEPPMASALMGRKMRKYRYSTDNLRSHRHCVDSLQADNVQDEFEEEQESDDDSLCSGTTPPPTSSKRQSQKPPPKPMLLYKDPGDFAAKCEKEWEANNSEVLKLLYEDKQYLKAGIYSVDYKTGSTAGISKPSDAPFNFPLPMFFSGEALMNEERDFYLPMDITLFSRMSYEQVFGVLMSLIVDIFIERKPRKAPNLDLITCQCRPSQPSELGCTGEECLNRCTCIECDPSRCLYGELCQNQRFQRREQVDELDSKERGFGLKTNVGISQGSLIIEYRGEIISEELCMERMRTIYKEHQHYFFLNYDGDEVLDGTRKGTDARFINHSCDPNCHIEKQVNGEYAVGVFASRDIPADSELTYDYRFQAFGPMQRCFCRSDKCRGYIGLNKKAGEKQREEEEKAASAARRLAKRLEKPKQVCSLDDDAPLPPTELDLQHACITLPPSERKYSLVYDTNNKDKRALVFERMESFSRRQYCGQLPTAFKEIMKIRSHLRDTQLVLVRNYKPMLLCEVGEAQMRSLIEETFRKRRTRAGTMDEMSSCTNQAILMRRKRHLSRIIEDLAESMQLDLKVTNDPFYLNTKEEPSDYDTCQEDE